MAKSAPPAPQRAVSEYLSVCDTLLDRYAHGELCWTAMLDHHSQATARLRGQLAERFLVRAHYRGDLTVQREPLESSSEVAGR